MRFARIGFCNLFHQQTLSPLDKCLFWGASQPIENEKNRSLARTSLFCEPPIVRRWLYPVRGTARRER